MTLEAHVGGLSAAAKRAKLDDALHFFRAAVKWDRMGLTDRATWAAVNGAKIVSEYYTKTIIGRVDVGE